MNASIFRWVGCSLGCADSNKIADFVLRILSESGGRIDRQGLVWTAHLPGTAARIFGVPTPFRFTFDPAGAGAGVELLTIGNQVLDQMIQYARQRGLSCNFIFIGSWVNDFVRQATLSNPWETQPIEPPQPESGNAFSSGAFQRMCTVLRAVKFVNARQRLVSRRILYQRQVLFRFRVAFCSDEKREMLFTVLVDPVTEATDTMINAAQGVAMPTVWRGKSTVTQATLSARRVDAPDRGSFLKPTTLTSRMESLEAGDKALRQGDSYTWFRLYHKACEHLEESLRTEQFRLQSEADSRLDSERKRLEAYYRGMSAETLDPLRRVFRRMASAESRIGWDGPRGNLVNRLESLYEEAMELRQEYQAQLETLEADRERRLEELVEKYRIRTEVYLSQVSLIHVPRIAWILRLTGPARRELTVLYDILRERIVELECDACEKSPQKELFLCECADLICIECGPNCHSCGKTLPGWETRMIDTAELADSLPNTMEKTSNVVGG